MEELVNLVVTFCCKNLTWVAFSSALVLFVASYAYFVKALGFWSRQGVQGPSPWPIFGNLLEIFFTPQHALDMDRVRKFGRIYGTYEGSLPVLCITDPVVIKQLLVKDFNIFPDRRPNQITNSTYKKFLFNLAGEEWRRSRSTMTPTFTSGKIKAMFDLMKDCSKSLDDELASKANGGQEIDLKHLYGCYTMDVIGKCCFSIDTNAFKDPSNEYVKNASNFFEAGTWTYFKAQILPASLKWFFGVKFLANDVDGFFQNVATAVIQKRKKIVHKGQYQDFVQILLDAHAVKENNDVSDDLNYKGKAEEEMVVSENQINSWNIKKSAMDEDEMVAQSVLFFAAGFETTASLLTFCSYAMALNQDVQELLYKEIKDLVDELGEVDYDALISNKYLDAFVSETLRMFDPAMQMERKAGEDYVIKGTDIKIPKDGIVYIPIFAIHHDAEFYPQPEKFDPTRFLPENRDNLVPYTYLPFGAGPRNCIGMRFALVEAKLALVRVVSKFKFIKSKSTIYPPKFGGSRALLQMESAIVSAVVR